MTKVRRVFAGGVVIFGVLFFGRIADAQTDQRLLAQQLHGPQGEQRTKALNAVRRMRAADIKDDLRIALISLLAKKNQIAQDAVRRGQTVDQVEDPSFIAAVSREVAKLGDARAIPALCEAIDGGTIVAKALAEFGEAAVPDLLRVVNSPDAHYDLVDHGLIALRIMAERPDYQSVSRTTQQQIRAAAAQRLKRPGYFTSLWRAIDLAVVLKDPELRQVIESLASNRNAVTATGITYDWTVIEMTQKRAAERLAGVLPTPRF